MLDPITPKALRKGDTIAFVAPSSRINHIFPLRIQRAKQFLESQGFQVKDIFSPSLPSTSLRASVEARAEEVHSAFRDDTIHAIVCCIGGLTANELLPYLDYDLIRAHPKIFVGSSDITLIHYALRAGAGLRTFYGPSAITQLAEYPAPLDFTWTNFVATLMADPSDGSSQRSLPRALEYTDEFLDFGCEPDNLRPRVLQPAPGWKWLRGGQCEGNIVGGCLPSILQLFGTAWELSYKGKVLLLELPDGPTLKSAWPLSLVRWNLGDLATRGVWRDVVGVVLGRTYLYSAEETAEWESMVLEFAEEFEFPILSGVDVGHTDPMLTLPLDTLCRLDSDKDEWRILEDVVLS
ncbi:hypothetical protein VHEMI01044 [[Torrubiella] hemipterigena]|uniref:LD-carboxypeptidase n=1 Tax=[Torrubiella] hemipterigena TaxID=1531966 RepID=A0A0A1SS12_9HYPO|nr:hypothetical protein VHEMI01044 [[Torrubiella] hemipterigena]